MTPKTEETAKARRGSETGMGAGYPRACHPGRRSTLTAVSPTAAQVAGLGGPVGRCGPIPKRKRCGTPNISPRDQATPALTQTLALQAAPA